MICDDPIIFRAFNDILARGHYTNEIFVMGRSLGSVSTTEIAYHYQKRIKGLAAESGFASIVKLLSHLSFLAS
jgi:pimeloyl-ACP methyl ester carboxylesterase